MDETSLTVVRTPAWQALLRRLDAAVARDPRLADARDVVLRPVELLRVMAADAHGALADDVLRGDRLRAMLFIAWPYVAVAAEARQLLEAKGPPTNADTSILADLTAPASHGTPQLEWPASQPYEPGVIDHAGLLVLALAAARVADVPFAPVFVASIHGLALASSAAEVLGRLDPRQPDAESLDVVLHTLYMIEAARTVTRNEFLRPFVFDPVERGRWRCLAELMASELIASAVRLGARWDGATSDEILELVPKGAGVGETIAITVRGADPLRGATVVFASADGPLRTAEATIQETSDNTTTIRVTVPDGACPGWIGFSREDLIRDSNSARDGLRKQLEAELKRACVDGIGRIDPVHSIPYYAALATPRRRGTNRFEGGVPSVVHIDIVPDRVRPGDAVVISWETAGADSVRIVVGGQTLDELAKSSGTREISAPANGGVVTVVVTPRAMRGGRSIVGSSQSETFTVHAPVKIAAVEVKQEGRTSPLFEERPLDVVVQLDAPATVARAQLLVGDNVLEPVAIAPGKATFHVASDFVRDGMVMSAVIDDGMGARDTRSVGPLAVRAVIRAEVVLVRSAIVARRPLEPDPDRRRPVDRSLDTTASGTPFDDSATELPIDIQTAHASVIEAARSVGIAASIVDLPWADDDLAALVGRPTGDSDPMLLRVLEALSRRALVTPRFEHAIWLALLPEASRPAAGSGDGASRLPYAMRAASLPVASVARSLPANAARAVAVATPSGLERLFRALYPSDAEPGSQIAVGQRLAILGTLYERDITIDDIRVDSRGEGPGAPNKTSLEAVALDPNGRELDHVPIRVLTASRPASLAVLVPVSADVGSIEIRDEYRTVYKVIERTRGELVVSVDRPQPSDAPRTFSWTWSHTRNARPTAAVVLRNGEIETPVLAIDPCSSRVEVPLSRFPSGELRLYATDGWNKVEQDVSSEAFSNPNPVVLRRLSDGRFFADAPAEWTLTWFWDDSERAKNVRTFELEPGEEGVLKVVAQHDGPPVEDSLRIER